MTETNVYLLYHFFHPDDVISARLFTELGISLVDAGCDVIATPGNARCHDYRSRLPRNEEYEGVSIRRVFRPALSQHRAIGRLINTLFLLGGWAWRALWLPRASREVMIVGTDPILAVSIVIAWRLFRPRATIIHWCHDLYPDAAISDGLLEENSFSTRLLRKLLRFAYRRCDTIADLGPCMRARLMDAYGINATEQSLVGFSQTHHDEERIANDNAKVPESGSRAGETSVTVRGTTFTTLVPWALVEPSKVAEPNGDVRKKLFGQEVRLGILYSGNLGRAHHFNTVLNLARNVRSEHVHFCFAGRGPGIEELRRITSDQDENICFAGFADESELFSRLTATDIHLVTLRENWTGTVVPSKFFGALAVGRPVLFAGHADSAIAKWIRKYRVGWVLTNDSHNEVAGQIISHAASCQDIEEMRYRCLETYQRHFSKTYQLQKWRELVLGLSPVGPVLQEEAAILAK